MDGIDVQLSDRLSAEDSIRAATAVLQAVSYPLRMRIVLYLLAKGEATGGELSRDLGVSHSLAAHHLHQLRVVGLLHRRRLANHVVDRANPATADLIQTGVTCATSG